MVALIQRDHPRLSIKRQCSLLGINRSTYYYTPVIESTLNLELMRLMDEHYLLHPYKGVPRMHVWLTRDKGYNINIKRIERLYYDLMGLRAIVPGPHTSKRHPEHAVFPYLLRNKLIINPNQVWATDITYIPMLHGYLYLMAIIDVYSRFILSWDISNTMDSSWCANLVQHSIEQWGVPEIINTDQGSQFTSEEFTSKILGNGIKLSMDGKGRAIDNIFIERFWRTIKYEHVYLNPTNDGQQLFDGINIYMNYYNMERRHESLDYCTPYSHYQQKIS
jgi:putative transposase